MVHHGAAKMSKSAGNLVMVRDLLERWPADAIHLALVRHHYRIELTWTDALAAAAKAAVDRWTRAVAAAPPDVPAGEQLPEDVAALREEALAALGDDLDTPHMVAVLDQFAANALATGRDVTHRAAAGAVLRDLATRILGLRLEAAR
jgi:cysteinyl-tRNA synthetase